MTLKASPYLPPAWECRCKSCKVAVSHGAPEEDRDYDGMRAALEQQQARIRELEQALRLIVAREKFPATDYVSIARAALAAPKDTDRQKGDE